MRYCKKRGKPALPPDDDLEIASENCGAAERPPFFIFSAGSEPLKALKGR
jgi:hypothetical protein